jgi:hypothetical protein
MTTSSVASRVSSSAAGTTTWNSRLSPSDLVSVTCIVVILRPGKVPVAHLRKVYGRSVMADVVQNAVNEANQKIVEGRRGRSSASPRGRS